MECPLPLTTAYDLLSEYAHPNMSSNQASISAVGPGVYQFGHKATITAKYIELLGVLSVCVNVFEEVTKFYHDLLTGGGTVEIAAETA